MAFLGGPSHALGQHQSMSAPSSIAGRCEGPLRNKGDHMSERYAMLADDSSVESRRREASMLFCSAERFLEDEVIGEALKAAVAALPLFRAVEDTKSVHDTLRIIVHAQRMEATFDHEERPVEAERFARQELAAFETSNDRRGKACMLLSLAECRCDYRGIRPSQLAEAEAQATEALDIFTELRDEKMMAITLLELARMHALRHQVDSLLDMAGRSRDLFQTIEDKLGGARALHAMAIGNILARKLSDGLSQMKEALSVFRDLGNKKYEAFELCVMAEVHLEDEKPLKALPVARESLTIFRDINYGKGWEATALYAVVRALIEKQQSDVALKLAREGVEKLRFKPDRRQLVFGQEVLVDALLASNLPDEALQVCAKAIETARELDDKRLEMGVLHCAMWTHVMLRDPDKAMDQMDEVSDLAEQMQDDNEDAVAMHNLAFLHLQKGEYRQAFEKIDEACGLFQKAENKKGEASTCLVSAMVYAEQDRVQEAISKCIQARDLFRDAAELRGESEACTMLAELHMQSEECTPALKAAERSAELMKQFSNLRLEARALRLVARIEIEAERLPEAEAAALKAKQAASQVEDRAEMTHAQLQLTQVYAAMSEGNDKRALEKAMRSATEAINLSGRCNDRGLVAIARFVKAQLLRGTGRFEEALRTAEEAMRWFKKAEDSLGEARTLTLLGDVALNMHQKESAKEYCEQALKLAKDLGAVRAESEAMDLAERIKKSEHVPLPAAPVAQQAIAASTSQADAAAPAAEASAVATQPKGLDPAMVRAKVLEITRSLMAGEEDLDADSPFMEAGLDSLSSVQLMSELSKEFSQAMSPSLVFDFPTTAALSDHLVEESLAAAY